MTFLSQYIFKTPSGALKANQYGRSFLVSTSLVSMGPVIKMSLVTGYYTIKFWLT